MTRISQPPISQTRPPRLKPGEPHPKRNVKPTMKFTCCLSHQVLSPTNEDLVIYRHHDGQVVAFAYDALLEIVKRAGKSYFINIPYRRGKKFDIIEFLNQTRENIRKSIEAGKVDSQKLENTLLATTDILDNTKLSKFIDGGTSAFLTSGLVISSYPKK
ncbi:MAG: hypothetical protein WC456_04305 [Patescibacteria group bacterium]